MKLPSKLEFLWDEEKTRSAHKFALATYAFGIFIPFIYGLLLPVGTPYKTFIILFGPITVLPYTLVSYLLIKKPHQGIRLLISYLFAQTIAIFYLATTGGFKSVLQFIPFAFLFLTQFMLGTAATFILVLYSLLSFIVVFFWIQKSLLPPNTPQDLFFYIAVYLMLAFIYRNVGKELSIQIEARKKLEEVDELKNQFIALTSHYLRTPLTTIKNSIYLLNKTNLDEKQTVQLQIASSGIDELQSIVDKLLSLASLEKGTAKTAVFEGDLNQLISNLVYVYTPYAKGKEIDLNYQSCLENLPQLIFDEEKLKQVLMILLDNAFKFNKPAGKIIVTLKKEKNHAVIEVTDTGVGIKESQLETIFTAFNNPGMGSSLQLDKPGLGLNLYIAKLIVESQAGRIHVTSNFGIGSTFTITLPLISE